MNSLQQVADEIEQRHKAAGILCWMENPHWPKEEFSDSFLQFERWESHIRKYAREAWDRLPREAKLLMFDQALASADMCKSANMDMRCHMEVN